MKTVEMLDSATVQYGNMPRIQHWRKGERHEVPDEIATLWVGRRLCRVVGGNEQSTPKPKAKKGKPKPGSEQWVGP